MEKFNYIKLILTCRAFLMTMVILLLVLNISTVVQLRRCQSELKAAQEIIEKAPSFSTTPYDLLDTE